MKEEKKVKADEPLIFISRYANLRITDPKNPPRQDLKTGEANWGKVIKFKEIGFDPVTGRKKGMYIATEKRDKDILLNHPAFNTDYWLEQKPAEIIPEKVVEMVSADKGIGKR